MEPTEIQEIGKRFIKAIKLLVDRKEFKSMSKYGEKHGISSSTISDINAGRTNVQLEHIFTITKHYDFISLDYIMHAKGDLVRGSKSINVNYLKSNQVEDPLVDYESKEDAIKDLIYRIELLEKVVYRR